MTAFDYPPAPHVRRHGPQGYAGYESFRPWLRDEFDFRCVYCLRREMWGRVQGDFTLDHFMPVATHPERMTDYDNLVYACSACNAAKYDATLPDPCTALTATGVAVAADGTIQAHAPEARKIIRQLGLDERPATEFRMLWLSIIQLAARHDSALHRRLMSYPDAVPDLSRLRPPRGNTRPEGIEASHFRRRQRGELAETY